MRYKVGETLTVDYVALKRKTGLTNLKMQVWDEAGVEFAGSPITMIEVIAGTGETDLGLYTANFTPDAVGRWRIRIESATNKDDLSKIFEIQATKEDDIKSAVDNLDGDVVTLDGKVVALDGKVDNLDADVVAVAGQITNLDADVVAVAGQITDVKSQTQSIEDKIDAIDLEIDTGGYVL